jgi:hypothetical protein
MTALNRERVQSTTFHQSPEMVVNGVYQGAPTRQNTEFWQRTYSEENRWYYHKNRDRSGDSVRDIGGNFKTEKFIWEPQYGAERLFSARTRLSSTRYVNGNLHAYVPNQANIDNHSNTIQFHSDSVMDSWGTSAVSSVIPTKSKVELATTAAEIVSGGLPKLMGQGLLKSVIKDHRKVGQHSREAASEYLNYEFGIKPLISDLVGTAQTIVSAAERIRQLERDSGRLVRRRFRFPIREETIITKATGAAAVPAGWSYTYLWNGSLSGHRRESHDTLRVDRWFSGAFTYHLNIGERQRNQLYAAADNARLLLGVKLDADVLWNLTPWSWLADWFGNVGDIATNVSHFGRDGLVMPYGYVMTQTESIRWRRLHSLNWFDMTMPNSITDSCTFVRKQRRRATPFGFGLSDMILDTRQTAILGALGVSRAPRMN